MAEEVAAGIAAIVSEDKLIPALRFAPQAFVANGALTYTAIAGAFVKAHHIMAFVFIAGCI